MLLVFPTLRRPFQQLRTCAAGNCESRKHCLQAVNSLAGAWWQAMQTLRLAGAMWTSGN